MDANCCPGAIEIHCVVNKRFAAQLPVYMEPHWGVFRQNQVAAAEDEAWAAAVGNLHIAHIGDFCAEVPFSVVRAHPALNVVYPADHPEEIPCIQRVYEMGHSAGCNIEIVLLVERCQTEIQVVERFDAGVCGDCIEVLVSQSERAVVRERDFEIAAEGEVIDILGSHAKAAEHSEPFSGVPLEEHIGVDHVSEDAIILVTELSDEGKIGFCLAVLFLKLDAQQFCAAL